MMQIVSSVISEEYNSRYVGMKILYLFSLVKYSLALW